MSLSIHFHSSLFPFLGGHYIYIEGDSATHGDTARLLSKECTDPQPQCLQFWYHMYGSSWTMGLSVYLLHGNRAREVWRKRENQGNTWHRALVDLTPQENFKVSGRTYCYTILYYCLMERRGTFILKKYVIESRMCSFRLSLKDAEVITLGLMWLWMTSLSTEELVAVLFN